MFHYPKSPGTHVLRRRAAKCVTCWGQRETKHLSQHFRIVASPPRQAKHCDVAFQVQPKIGLGHDVSQLMGAPRGMQVPIGLAGSRQTGLAQECGAGERVGTCRRLKG